MLTLFDNLYAAENSGAVLLVSGALGGGAAWLAGRAVALAWRSALHVVPAMILLAAAARFIHFALFGGNLLSLSSFGCDFAIFLVVGLIAWRTTRAAQMVRQYPWLYARAGALSWREIAQENRNGSC
jgi:hypothetical protein